MVQVRIMKLNSLLHGLQKGPAVADTVIGEGNTTEWKMCGLDKSTCLTVFFDLSASDRSNAPGAVNPQLYLQFLTRYIGRAYFSFKTFFFFWCSFFSCDI